MKLSIIIPVYNNIYFTQQILQDLIKLPRNHEIIIIDNGSTDNTQEVINYFTLKHNIQYTKLNKNHGFSYANNKGYTLAKGEFILFLNNDVKIKKTHASWTNKIIKEIKNNQLFAIEAGLLDNNFNFMAEGKNIDLNKKLSYLSGWCLGGTKKTFNKLILPNHKGPWNEEYFLYFEDDDISFRAKQLNISLKLIKLPLHHFGRMTGKYLNMKNNFLKSQKIFINNWKDKVNL